MNTQNCSEILNLIPSYIDDILDDEEKDRVAEHIKSCANCRAEYELMSSIAEKTKDLPDITISADFHKNLIKRAETLQARKRARRTILLRRSGAGVAAAAVVALSVVSFGNLSNSKTDLDNPVYTATPSPDSVVVTTEDVSTHSDNNARVEVHTKEAAQSVDTPKDTKAEVAPAPITENVGGGSSAASPEAPSTTDLSTDMATMCDDLSYMKAVITLDDTNREAVMGILTQYEKDEIGYRVPDINKVMRKIAELGITATAESCEFSQNYIIVK